MPVGVEVNVPGATLDQYDQVIEKLGLTAGGKAPPGELFHWVTATDDGIRVINVWETKEQWEKWLEGNVGPAMAEVGVPGPPEVTYSEVHNYFTA
jgi:hypothetical protein